MDEYKSLSHTKWECKYHVVFIPKCRRKTLYAELRKHLGEVFRRLAEQKESRIEEGHLMPDNTQVNAIKAWDRSGNVIYCASLNKILAPGMRLGWLTAGRWHTRAQMLQLTQTHNNEEWSQATAKEFMETPMFDRHIQRLRSALRSQRERITNAVARYFPVETRMSTQEEGMTLWIELPEKLSSDALFNAGLQEGILIAPGPMFSNSDRFDHFFRINCGLLYSTEVDNALLRLGQAAARLLRG